MLRCGVVGREKREKRIGAKGIKKEGKKEEEDMVVGIGSLSREWQCTVPLWLGCSGFPQRVSAGDRSLHELGINDLLNSASSSH